MPALSIDTLVGKQIGSFIPDLARLRITVFREFPYLYEGDTAYEEKYLQVYSDSPKSLLVLIRDGLEVVGTSTAIPLADENEDLKKPFLDAGIDVHSVLYFGESVILPNYRGMGFGVTFFNEREKFAREQGFAKASFCAVVRGENDVRRPAGYKPLNAFWEKRGFRMAPELKTEFSWKEIGEVAESNKPMQFWMKDLEPLSTEKN